MAKRKSLFELLIENGNVNLEIEYKTILKLLEDNKTVNYRDSILYAIDYYIIPNWIYAGRCIELDDLMEKLGIAHKDILLSNYSLEKCLLFFELIYNLVQLLVELCEDKTFLGISEVNKYHTDKIISNIEELTEELNYEIVKFNDKYQIIEKDIIITAVAENNPDICGDIIEYRRFNLKGDIETKRAIILKLADKLEPLENRFKSTSYNTIMNDVQMLLNNLNLRHNNLKGKHKKEFIANMSLEQLEEWYDKTYDLILSILQINEYLRISFEIDNLSKNLK